MIQSRTPALNPIQNATPGLSEHLNVLYSFIQHFRSLRQGDTEQSYQETEGRESKHASTQQHTQD